MAKTGVLLLNIGSPQSYEVPDVKKYLENFLMDKDVINLPWLFRWILVKGLIVPRRAPFSAANYKKVWLNEGSPLTVYTDRFAAELQSALGPKFYVTVGMRYSMPSIQDALDKFKSEQVDSILLAPLFPQYAEATTGSSIKESLRLIKENSLNVPVKKLNHFYANKDFVQLTAQSTREALKDSSKDPSVEHYLFSFHGLPESHVRKMQGCLQNESCCLQQGACEKPCYRAQCFATASAVAKELGLSSNQWSVSYQSRLGREEWLKPSTDHSLDELAKSGKTKIAVLCPSFVADCIETLEEIGIGGKADFLKAGGKEFHLIPCLNDSRSWAKGFADLIRSN